MTSDRSVQNIKEAGPVPQWKSKFAQGTTIGKQMDNVERNGYGQYEASNNHHDHQHSEVQSSQYGMTPLTKQDREFRYENHKGPSNIAGQNHCNYDNDQESVKTYQLEGDLNMNKQLPQHLYGNNQNHYY